MNSEESMAQMRADMVPLDEIETALDSLASAYGWDWDIKFEGGYEFPWSATLRVTMNPNADDKADRSMVTYAVGGADPGIVAFIAWVEMNQWIEEVLRAAHR